MIYLFSLLLSIITAIALYDFVSIYVDTTSTYIYLVALVMYFYLFWFIIINLLSNKKIIIDNKLKILYILTILTTLFLRVPSDTAHYNIHLLFNDPYFKIDFVFLFNMILFIPLPFLFKIKWYYVLIGFVGIELVQYLFHLGSFDINDIILYIVGYVIGLLCIKIYKKRASIKS